MTAKVPFEAMSKEELVAALRELERSADAGEVAKAEQMIHELQTHRIELEMQNRQLQETQALLEESRNRYVDLYDFAPIPYCTFDESGSIEDLNLTAAKLLGRERQFIVGKPFAAFLSGSDVQTFHRQVRACFDGQACGPVDLSLTVRGRKIPVEMVSRASRDLNDDVIGCRAIFNDLSARKRAEDIFRFLCDTGTMLAPLVDEQMLFDDAAKLAVPLLADICMIYIPGLGERVVRAAVAAKDQATLEVLQATEATLAPFPILVGVPALRNAIWKALHAGQSQIVPRLKDLRIQPEVPEGGLARDRGRDLGVLGFMTHPIVGRNGVIGATAFLATGPERSYAVSDVAVVEDFTRRIAVAVENARLYQQSREAARARADLVALVSHDLGSPLAAIRMTAHLIVNPHGNEAPEVNQKRGDLILRAAEEMKALISDLLQFHQLEGGRVVLHLDRHGVRDLIEDCLDLMRPLAVEASIQLVGRITQDLPLRCDRHRIIQALSNLVGNAIKFTAPGGTVTVSAETAFRAIQISVQDTGDGIPPEEQATIFDRYSQARNTGRAGNGLGLSIAKGIVEAHGGRIWVESQVGAGSTFYFTVPSQESRDLTDSRAVGIKSVGAGDGGTT
jgi:PAS domain S-box-containing protein